MRLFDSIFRVTFTALCCSMTVLAAVAWWLDLPRLERYPNDPWWHFVAACPVALALFLAVDRWQDRRYPEGK